MNENRLIPGVFFNDNQKKPNSLKASQITLFSALVKFENSKSVFSSKSVNPACFVKIAFCPLDKELNKLSAFFNVHFGIKIKRIIFYLSSQITLRGNGNE